MSFLSDSISRVLARFGVVALVVSATIAAAAPSCADENDELAGYFERHGLLELLALHLEDRLNDAPTNEARQAMAIRLAEIYAGLLEDTDDLTLRVDLEARSRELLSIVPESHADELHLALLRGAYVLAERIAEQHRLRMADEADIARATDLLAEYLPQFSSLRQRLQDRLDTLDRMRRRSDPEAASRVTEQIYELRELYNRCLFLNAWALYYQSFLTHQSQSARIAEGLFVEILEPETRSFRMEDVSKDLLSQEAYARTLLGYALCRSITARMGDAIAYLELLEGEDVFAPIREQAPAWKMSVILERGEFLTARNMIEARAQSEEDPMPLVWVRLAAVYALEADDADREAARLAQFAIAELAGRGELEQVLDLAERYGADALGTEGFAALYVRGVQKYRAAREMHDSDEPTAEPQIMTVYSDAARFLMRAVSESDAEQFQAAAAGAHQLIGWCEYFQGRFNEARVAFEAAAAELPTGDAPEALWMAIVSLDRLAQRDPSPRLATELDSLIEKFIQRYPSSEYTPKLVLRQSDIGASRPSPEVVDELLRIPAQSEDYEVAQRKAAVMLYQLWQDAAGNERIALAEQYINVALPLWMRTDIDTLFGDDNEFTVFLIRGRRILEVSLAPDVERYQAATEVLNRLEALAGERGVDLSEIDNELDYRRMQVALATGAFDQARLYADRIWEREKAGDWARAAMRTMLREAVQRWRSATEEQDVRDTLDRVMTYGKRVLQEFEQDPDALQEQRTLIYYATVAEAAMASWETHGNRETGEFALLLYQKLLGAVPSNATFLRAVGLLAEGFEQYEVARESWNRLATGYEAGSQAWYEAKYHLLFSLLHLDPHRAREVFDQHRALNPELGDETWRPRFESLDKDIDHAIRMQRIEVGESGDDDEEQAAEGGDDDDDGDGEVEQGQGGGS